MVTLGSHSLRTGADGFVSALAPMANVTNPPYRTLAREHGCGLTVTEMLSAEKLVQGGPREEAFAALRMERSPNEELLVVQLFGGDPATMAEAARIAEAFGANAVDINMGCPIRRIAVGCAAGVALMREPSRAASVVRAMTAAVKIPVTAKLRAGWDDRSVNAVDVACALEDAGAAMLTVHARTREQVHNGAPQLSIVRDVKRAVRVPVFGNGGVQTLDDARTMARETGCDGVMIGRGAHGNPWLFQSIDRGAVVVPDARQRVDALLRHLLLYVGHAGERRAAREMRKYALWYLAGTALQPLLRARLPSLDSIDALRDAVLALRDSPPADQ